MRPVSANDAEEPEFHNQDEWRRAEYRRVVGGDRHAGSTRQEGKLPNSGLKQDSEAPSSGGAKHSRAPGVESGSNPTASLFTADVAAALIAICLLVLIVVALLRYTPGEHRPEPKGNPQTIVWVDKQSGRYFCPGTNLYGKGRGEYMTQRAARLEAFRPALYSECE